MAADTERLFIQLEARISEFEKRMAKAERRGTRTYNQLQRGSRSATRTMERDMARASGRINTALASTATAARTVQRSMMMIGLPFVGAAGVGAITRGVRGAVSDLSDLGKTARDVSLDVEDLQGLMRGFERETRVTGEQAAQAFERFNRRVGEAANGTGEMNRIVERYGIRLRDANGELRDQGTLLREVANAIRGAATDQERAAIAQAAFGDVGRQMAAAMREGSGAIDRMIREAIDAGDVIDRDLIQRAEILDDRFDELTRSVANFFKTLAVGIAGGAIETPLAALERLFGTVERARNVLGDDLFEALSSDPGQIEAVGGAVEGVAISFEEMVEAMRSSSRELDSMAAALFSLGEVDLGKAVLELSDELVEAQIGLNNGTVSAREFETAVQDVAGRAVDLVDEIDALDESSLEEITSSFGKLFRSIVNATNRVRILKSEMGEMSPATARRKEEVDDQKTARERDEAAAALREYLAESERLASRDREQIELEREIQRLRTGAIEQGIEMTKRVEEEIDAQARLNVLKREGSGASQAGDGGAGGSGADEFQRAVEGIRARTRALEMEAEAVAVAAASGRDYASALQYAQARARLLNAAQSEGLAITPELTSAVNELADAYSRAGESAQEAAGKLSEAEENAKRGARAVSDLFMALADDSRDATKVLANLLRQIAQVQMQRALMGLSESGADGGFLSWLGGLLGGGFSAGGYTGPGARGEPAGIVHRGEYVFSKRAVQSIGKERLETLHRSAKGYAGGGYVGGAAGPSAIGGKAVLRIEAPEGFSVQQLGDIEGIAMQVTRAGIGEYDRRMPGRVQQIQRDPRRRG